MGEELLQQPPLWWNVSSLPNRFLSVSVTSLTSYLVGVVFEGESEIDKAYLLIGSFQIQEDCLMAGFRYITSFIQDLKLEYDLTPEAFQKQRLLS